MKKKAFLILIILFEASILFFGNSFLGLFESSEGRYAEVAREMLETKDFLSPQINYVYHFTKPPFAYWMASLGMAIFGVNPFGARFFVTIFALLTLLLVYKIAEEEEALFSTILLGSFILFVSLAKVLTTDMFLTFFITLLVFIIRQYERGVITKNIFDLSFGFALGMAILTKGQIPLLYIFLILLGFAYSEKSFKVFKIFSSPLLILIAGVTSGWWFLVVGLRHPGLIEYLFTKEAIEASYSAKRFHPGPFYYYFPVMFIGLFPYILMFPSLKEIFGDKRMKSLLGWTIFPFILFSLFEAKLPTYLLPTTPGFSLLLARSFLKKEKRIFLSNLSFSITLFFAIIFVFLKGQKILKQDVMDIFVILLFGFMVSLFSLYTILKKEYKKGIVIMFIALLFSMVSIPAAISKNQEKFKIAFSISSKIKEELREKDKIVELRTTIFSIPFYTKTKVYAFENNFFRKKFTLDKPSHILQGEEELNKFFKENRFVYVIVDKNSEKFLNEKYSSFKLVYRGERYILYASTDLFKRRVAQ